MPVVPVLPAVTGGVYTTSQVSALVAVVRFNQRPPVANLRQTTLQTFTTSVAAAVAFNAEDSDDDVDGIGGHDNATNNTRWTARYPGLYLISGGITWVANATGLRLSWFRVNGIDINGTLVELTATGGGAVSAIPALTFQQFLAIGDYVELIGFQSSGGNLNTSVTSTDQPHMTVAFKSKLS